MEASPTDVLVVGPTNFVVGRARRTDVAALVALLRDDVLGAGRELDDLAPYERAFDAIARDPAHLLVVVRDAADGLVGTMQLTLLPGLARAAVTRLQIEGVRVAAAHRGSGLGSAMFAWAHEYGRRHGAGLVQLTTDTARQDARRFYERLGYRATHHGMKLELDPVRPSR